MSIAASTNHTTRRNMRRSLDSSIGFVVVVCLFGSPTQSAADLAILHDTGRWCAQLLQAIGQGHAIYTKIVRFVKRGAIHQHAQNGPGRSGRRSVDSDAFLILKPGVFYYFSRFRVKTKANRIMVIVRMSGL